MPGVSVGDSILYTEETADAADLPVRPTAEVMPLMKNLTTRLFLPIMVVLVLGLATAAYLIGRITSSAISEILDAGIESLSENLSADIVDFFDQYEDQLAWEARKEVYQKLFAPYPGEEDFRAADRELRFYADRDRSIGEIRITDTAGWIIATSSEVNNLWVGDRRFFIRALNGESAVSDVLISRVTGRPTLNVAVPFFSRDNLGVSGVIYSPIDYEEFCRTMVDGVRIGEGSYAFVVDSHGRIAAHPERELIQSSDLHDFDFGREILLKGNGRIRYEFRGTERLARFVRDPVSGWTSVVSVDVPMYFRQVHRSWGIVALVMGVTFILIGLTVFSATRGMTRAITALVRDAGVIASGRFGRKLECGFSTELSDLAVSFQIVVDALREKIEEAVNAHEEGKRQANDELSAMIGQLREKKSEAERNSAELYLKSEELEQSLESLREAQARLIETEKQASLGRLVSGVAHEINTPLGISVTGISFVEDLLKNLSTLLSAADPDREEIERILGVMQEGVVASRTNLMRAAELVGNFKQISVDQASEMIRTFELGTYLQEILQSLAPRWKRTGFDVELTAGEPIAMHSYPGALMQIITNLVENSLVHGFDDRSSGRIVIDVSSGDGTAVITVSDDGRGMDAETLAKLYDPFFTTKRHAGGSGLGMHIVYNMVRHKLAGSITCDSAPHKGTRFILRIPQMIEELPEAGTGD